MSAHRSERPIMRILFLADDVLFPTTNGGRVELLGEIRCLLEAGHALDLVVFHREPVDSAVRDLHTALVPGTVLVPRGGLARTSLRRPLQPYQLASRRAPRPVPEYRPDVIVASHEWTLRAARTWARRTGAPVLLRSHNDEGAFLRSLARHAGGGHSLYLRAEAARLDLSVRAGLLTDVSAVGVISPRDTGAYRRFRGLVEYLPPVFPDARASERRTAATADRVAFVGSLDQSHTETGLRWFVHEVLPRLRRMRPGVRLLVAGRRAPAPLATYLEGAPGVDFAGEVEDPAPFYSARVFVNPVFSGSGVNMKMGAPGAAGQPVVSTRHGVRGLGSFESAALVADTPEGFARACSVLLTDDGVWAERSARMRAAAAAHSPARVGEAWTRLLERIAG
jgi:glycosyltransferase involved in cell wall biosynthesis